MSEEFKIPLTNTLIQSIGDYLISRPYKEVAMLIGSLQQEVQAGVKPNGLSRPVNPDAGKLMDEITGDPQ